MCAAACAVPFLVTYRMPMNDLPQHAAQVTLWKHYSDPCYRFDLVYDRDWFTPYLLGYSIARFFGAFLSVNNALKLTAYLAVVALPLALRMLTTRAGIDPWLSLFGFPLAIGFSFYWGFLNFIVAVPLGIVFVAWAYDYSLQPAPRRGAALTLLALLLLASHALVFLVCAAIAGAMHSMLWRDPKRMLITALPYTMPVPFALLWAARVRSREPRIQLPTTWNETWLRPIALPFRLLGSELDPAAIGFVFVLAAIAILCGVRPSRDPRRWLPLIIAALCYFFGPARAFGTAMLFQRFAVFVAVFLLFALDGRSPLVRAALAHGLLLAAVVLWFAILTVRFGRFSADAGDFDRAVDGIPANASLLYLDLNPRSTALPGMPFLHFAAYYQERKGGILGRSFASHFPELMRYRPGFDPGAAEALERDPSLFRWDTNDSHFDFFLVRAENDFHDVIFRHATEPVELKTRAGMWWLYAKRRMAPHRDCPPFQPDDREAQSR